jgi:hypothetical protein
MKRSLLLLSGPVLLIALLVTAVALRPGALGTAKRAAPPAPEAVAAVPADRPPVPRLPGKPAPPETVAKQSEDVRVRSTFANYRTAIATKNTRMADALYPVLLRDRATALKCAEEEVAKATTDFDREIAQQTLNAFRR